MPNGLGHIKLESVKKKTAANEAHVKCQIARVNLADLIQVGSMVN